MVLKKKEDMKQFTDGWFVSTFTDDPRSLNTVTGQTSFLVGTHSQHGFIAPAFKIGGNERQSGETIGLECLGCS